MSDLMSDFCKCAEFKKEGGYYDISCKLGLWGVSGDDAERVLNEAFGYWCTYNNDGEYHDILGGSSPKEIMLRGISENIKKYAK